MIIKQVVYVYEQYPAWFIRKDVLCHTILKGSYSTLSTKSKLTGKKSFYNFVFYVEQRNFQYWSQEWRHGFQSLNSESASNPYTHPARRFPKLVYKQEAA